VALYSLEERRVLQFKPGITSAASLLYRNEQELLHGPDWEKIYREKVMPGKLAIDLEYMRRRTLWSDLGLIFKTIVSVGR